LHAAGLLLPVFWKQGKLNALPLAGQIRPASENRRIASSPEIPQDVDCAPVAQMDRACASGAQGREFEPLRARHFFNKTACSRRTTVEKSEGGDASLRTV
jgi:hypothetical protein